MARLCSGLIHRCNKHIYICTTTLNEQGSENKGPLLRVIQNIIRDNQISLETDEI